MKKIFSVLLVAFAFAGFSNPGDTTHVISHNAITVVTDPNTGAHGYKMWATFPSSSLPVRKIIAKLSYKCAPGMQCGAWDYLDYVYIRRVGGQAQPSKNIEAVRFITPYGNTFNSSWNFNWHMDVTDYSLFLRDSVEIEYIHGGYEATTVGWQVTVDFAFIEGTPVANPINFTQLWNGSFPYGNASNSIENYLTPDTIAINPLCAYTKLRLLHTGHGSDSNGCSEFCNKYRTIKFDGNVMNTRARWRTCGNNALFPQGGTWVYDRGNWCPGNIVQPDFTSSTSLTPGINHIFDMDMQTYTVTSQSANEVVNGQLFQFAAPNKSIDASIEEVYQPSTTKENNRLNPICMNPLLVVRNNGSTPVSSVSFKYGIQGSAFQSYIWNGNLNFGDTSSVMLPNFVTTSISSVNSIFKVYIDKVNNQVDQYNYDDSASIKLTSIPPTYDTTFLVVFRTNNYLEDSYYVTNASGNVVFSKVANNLQPNTTYYDTLHLTPGCYDISIYDTGGDGLSFWANTAQGSGLYRLKRLYTPNSIYLKTFGLDFGNFIKWNFFAVPNTFSAIKEVKIQSTTLMDVFPNPVSDKTTVEYSCGDKPQLQILDGLGRVVKQVELLKKEDFYTLDFNDLSKGCYWIKLSSQTGSVVKKVIKE
ncbi:MAG TPA: peptide-N-glycosidase F-related protein [Bacteroidia bacterium]|jgi:hypothetical protein|nr:peptide-N-glycosidase F-related protein [Bacteroidia bacterium]